MNQVELLLQDCIRACSREGIDLRRQNNHVQKAQSVPNNPDHKRPVTANSLIDILNTIDFNAQNSKILDSVKTSIQELNPSELPRVRDDLEKKYESLTGIPLTSEIKNGDELRNIYCYEYLRYLADVIPDNLKDKKYHRIFRSVKYFAQLKYNSRIGYGDLFTKFSIELAKLQNVIRKRINETFRDDALRDFDIKNYNELCYRVIANRNLAIERSHGMIRGALRTVRQTSKKVEVAVRNSLIGDGGSFINRNQISPQDMSTPFYESAIFWSDFKPQNITALPSVREYEYKIESDPIEIGLGTQGQFDRDIAIINPAFEAYLEAQEIKYAKKPKITHIYFNSLPMDKTGFFERLKLSVRSREIQLTDVLNTLEDKHENIAVITLPSTGHGLLDLCHLQDREKSITAEDAFNEMLKIAKGENGENDFYISPKIKQSIYGGNEDTILNDLLNASFSKLGFLENKDKLSPADRHAVFFHFIKFELTQHIINNLGPESINFSCKDGIDRGGISSAYFNLIKSIERGTPMSQDEFERGLHGRPTLVKGRAMNRNSQMIWNAIDAYIAGYDKDNTGKKPIPNWLREWHYKHAIPGSKAHHIRKLEKYIAKIKKEIVDCEGSMWCCMFPMSIQTKKRKEALAEGLEALCKKQKKELFIPSEKFEQLHDGRLGKIFANLKKDGVITKNRP